MKKLLKSNIAKIVASLLISVAIAVCVVTGITAILLYEEYRYMRRSPEQIADEIKEDELNYIASEYGREFISDYYTAVDGGISWDKMESDYSDLELNFDFVIRPNGEYKDQFPTISNFDEENVSESDYQYVYRSAEEGIYEEQRYVWTYYVEPEKNYNYVRNEIIVVGEYYDENGAHYVYATEPKNTYDGSSDLDFYEEVEGGIAFEEVESTTEAEADGDTEIDENFTELTSGAPDVIQTYDLTRDNYVDPRSYYQCFYGIGSDNYNESNAGHNSNSVWGYTDTVNERRNYVVSNGIHSFYDPEHDIHVYLDMDKQFCDIYNDMFQEIEYEYDYWECYENYDPQTHNYTVEIYAKKIVDVEFTAYIKNNFTVHDNFYYSPVLRYADFLTKYDITLFVISGILLLVFSVFLIAAAGHSNKSDEIYLTFLDRIPYEFIALVIAASVLGVMYAMDYHMTMHVICICATIALIIPVILLTTSARIKARTLFKNTIIYRIFRLIWRNGRTITRCIKILWNNFNIYGKYFGVFLAVALIELFFVCQSYIDGLVILIFVFEKLLFGAILIIACINMNRLKKAGNEIAKGNMDYEVDTSHMLGEFKMHGENLNSIRDGMSRAVEVSLKSERMKTELITNVSHDIKTPLTSIINYVDLLKKEDLDNKNADEYIEVLDRQSARLKKLIQDLIDASKASTGNLDVSLEKTDVNVVINQALGEFEDKLAARNLKTIVKSFKDECFVIADGRLLWRVMENLINNIVKYAVDNSRIYIDVAEYDSEHISVTFKNISKEELNISGDELMERFVRGDSSRNTEGSGLGLSIAKSLMELQKGKMEIIVDGDLFKVVLLLIVG